MAEIKSHEFDAYMKRQAGQKRLHLVYGPDRGLVSERANQLAVLSGIPLDDPFSIVKLEASDLQGNPARLLDEAYAIGLFNSGKLIWIRNAMNEKALIDGFQMLAAKPPEGTFVLIEAGDLKKGTGLRKCAESAASVAAIACYTDDRKALNALIDTELSAAGMLISPEGRLALLDLIGGDRIASRNEIGKLCLYCHDKSMIEEDDVLAIIGDASAVSTDDAIDAVLQGDADALHMAIAKITRSKTPLFLVLQGCLKQFQLLDQMLTEMDLTGHSANQIIASHGRHLHFRRKPIIEAALKIWRSDAVKRELSRLNSTIFQTRLRQPLEESIAMQTLLSITLQSRATAR